ncbi:glutamate-5-semialdehyde dehydrogenase [Blastopirellula marina]|uniref:Gamma-glutamyl phosphate reductase n=1 Tax=Blastopirellula marina TaxID=124 RepID=A0A2S8F3W6_9BACT|nr:glutamate-5-semialdehyde dehydrogenase [Blastopirellula marina]PQO26862.1 glutamate-5-semialdehyde dehydrogenase [Blastopirellula marina]PQO41550.1 glutamate-5-semialdehyde dehydrogenase [Blastopirellula marina]PTL41069.1 glutamate-5-semialdehyde dehydrogenase [Blastopirellula marina]
MSILENQDLAQYCLETALRAKEASALLALVSGAQKNSWLRESAKRLRAAEKEIIAANALDLAAAPQFGLTPAEVDRLKLDGKRIEGIASGLEQIAMLEDPIGRVIESTVRPNGLDIQKVRVPLGVVFFIYESRPNVTADAAAICVKSGNAVILRGGKEAAHSSRAIVEVMQDAALDYDIPPSAVQLVNTADRAAVGHFLKLNQYIDVAIPRGGEGLIRRVADEATMPVIKHFNGNCHVYVDRDADLDMAMSITVNSKCHRYGVCNAAESLVVHQDVADQFLPAIGAALIERGVEIRGDSTTQSLILKAKTATDEDFAAEYLGPIISVKVVESLDAAIRHINLYSSKHTESIITRNLAAAREFASRIDSSAVMINASTRFNDGGEFGLGAEIGISTDKFHARGPCGLEALTSYKYVVYGDGQIRS